jgi:ribosomal protein S18 acetylase RimI-like enzyme
VTVLRPAGPADAPSLAVLAERTFRDAFAARNTPENMNQHCARVFGEEIQRQEIMDHGLVTTIAEDDGRMTGFSQLRLRNGHASVAAERPAELNRIYVVAEWQGRGVAKDLMRHALDSAASANCDCLWLGVWEHNPKAMAFYRRRARRVRG